MLYYARMVLLSQGWSVEEVWWNPEDIDSEDALISTVTPVLDRVADQNPLIVAKSRGTLALLLAVERGWPGIWLTPLLDRPYLVDALKVATSNNLLVGGTADHFWNSAVAKTSGQEVLEFAGADHDLAIPGDPVASVEILGELVSTMKSFVESL